MLGAMAGITVSGSALGQPFAEVPALFTQSPEAFRALFAAGRCGTVNAVLFGDSQETCPAGAGSVYVPRLQ